MHLESILRRLQPQPGFVYAKAEWAGRQRRATLWVHVRPRKGSRGICSSCFQKRAGYDAREHAVEHEHMEVHVKVHRRTKPLHEIYGAALGIVDSSALGACTVASEDRLDEDAGQRREHVGLERGELAKLVGSVRTYCLTGTSGRTRSTKCAAVLAMRRPQQLGQMLRPWHVKATRRS